MTAPHTQFELKAGTFTLPLLRLLDTDMDAMAEQLSDTVDQAESFFHNTPVVIDLKNVSDAKVEFPMLVGLMRGHGMIPVGVRGGTSVQHEAAEVMGLAVLADGRQSRATPHAPIKQPQLEASTTLVNRPIRSGQRIYAQGGGSSDSRSSQFWS